MYIGLHVKYPLFLSDFNDDCIFWTYFQRNAQISFFMKICPVGTKLLHVNMQVDGWMDGWTDI